jgi:hypothetical protein
MLMRRLVVVVQRANARLFLIVYHFLFQNFELELHKVDLLLQVCNIIVLGGLCVRI